MTDPTKVHVLAEKVAYWRRRIDAAKVELKALQDAHDQAEQGLFDGLENQGVRSVKVDGLGTFMLNDLAWARVVDPTKAREWALLHAPELINLNNQRLSKMVRDALAGEDGAVMPEGVDFATSRKITWRQS